MKRMERWLGASTLEPPQNPSEPSGDLGHWLAQVSLGTPQTVGPLTITPLLLDGEPGEPFLLLHEAIEQGLLEVVEQEHGTVNEVIAHNRGDRPILILEGESVMGAKQNRVITVDVLVAAGTSVPVYVGCVEQGRWDHAPRAFGSSPMPVEPALRAFLKVRSTSGAPVDQGGLWKRVSSKLGRMEVGSDTSSYHAVIDRYRARSEAAAVALAPVDRQVGILAIDDGRLVGFDLVGHPRNWGALAHRLASSYVLGSLDDDAEFAPRTRRTPEEWLRAIANAPATRRASQVGIGEHVALGDPALVGGGLWHEGRPAHLAVFGAVESS
jgi:hypothetical protein